MSKFSKKFSSGDSLSRSSRSLRTVNGYRRHVGKVPSLQNILKVIGTLSTPVYNSADSRGHPAMEMTVHPPSRLSHRSSASSNASQSQRSSHKGDYYRHQHYHHHGNHQLSSLQGNDVTNLQDFQTSMEYQKYCDVPVQSAAKHQHHVRQATTIAQWVAAASNNKEKLLDQQSEITRRQDGLPSALTPDSKTSRSSPNNYTSTILGYNCTSNNINNNNKNIKNDNNNSNNTYSSHSTRSNNSSHSNSHCKNVNKNNSSNVNNKSIKVNNTGITAAGTGNTNASGNTKKQDSPFISNKSEVKHSMGSVANDDDVGGGNGASEDWPCLTPYPTRCPSLEEENTYEFHQANINAALNSAMNVAKDGARHSPCLSEIRAEETEEKLKEEITAEAIKISNEVKSLKWNNSEMTKPESQGEINKTIGIVASKTEQKLLKEDSILKRKDMKLPKEINELSQSEKSTSKEHTQVKHTTPLALTKFHKEETRKPKMKDIKEEDRENKTVPQETEVKAKERELIKLKEKEGKTNIISIPTRDRLPRVAVSLRDGPKSQFLKIHQWHINKDGHLTLGCCLPLGDNQNGIKMEVSETPSSKDAIKCDTVPAATDSNESVCPVVSRMLKNGCIEPTVLAPPLAIYTVNSEQTYAPPTDLHYSAAQATTKMTLEGSQLPGAAIDATSMMTSTPLGVTLTFASSNSKDGALTASPTLIPIPISMLMTNHTPTMVPLNKIATEKPYDCDKDPGLHCLWRNPTSLEDLLAVLRSTCAPSAEGSPSCESVYAHRPRKKPVALRSRTGLGRRASARRRRCAPSSVLRALAAALRVHAARIYEHCALRHSAGAGNPCKDASDSEDERQHAADDDDDDARSNARRGAEGKAKRKGGKAPAERARRVCSGRRNRRPAGDPDVRRRDRDKGTTSTTTTTTTSTSTSVDACVATADAAIGSDESLWADAPDSSSLYDINMFKTKADTDNKERCRRRARAKMKARMKMKVRAMAKVIAKAKEQANAEKRVKAMRGEHDADKIYEIGEETDAETEAEMSIEADVKEENEPITSEIEPITKGDQIRHVTAFEEEASQGEKAARKPPQERNENAKHEAENNTKITPDVQQNERPREKRREAATAKRKVTFAAKVKAVSPTTKAQREAKARERAQAKLKAQVLARAKANLEAAARLKAEAMARARAEVLAKAEALRRAKEEAEAIRRLSQRAKEKAEAKKRLEARAKEAAESVEPHVLRRAAEAVLKAKAQALANAQAKVQAKAKVLARARSNSKVKLAEANEQNTKADTKSKEEGKAKIEVKSKEELKTKTEERSKDELKVRADVKTKPKDEVKQKEEPKPKNDSKAKDDAKTKPESKLKTVIVSPKGKVEQKGKEKAKPSAVLKVASRRTGKPKEGEESNAKNDDAKADEAIAKAMLALQKAGALAKARAQARAEAQAKAEAEAERKAKADSEAKAKFHERAMNFIRTKPYPLSCLMAIMEEPDHEGTDERFYTESGKCISLGTAQPLGKTRGSGASGKWKEQQASGETNPAAKAKTAAGGDRITQEGAKRESGETPHIALSLCDGRDHWPLDISQWHVSDEGQLVLSCSISHLNTAAATATPTPTPTPSAGKQPVSFTVNGASDRIRAVSNRVGQTLAPKFTSRYITSPIVIAPPVLAAFPSPSTSMLTPSANPALLLAVTTPQPTTTAAPRSPPPPPQVALATVPVAPQAPAAPAPPQTPQTMATRPSVPPLNTQGTMTDAPVPEKERKQITAEVEQQTSELLFAVYSDNQNPLNSTEQEAQFPFAQVQQSKVSEWAKLTQENTENAPENVTFSRNVQPFTSNQFHNQQPTNKFLDINQRSPHITFDNLSTFVNFSHLSTNSNTQHPQLPNTITYSQKSTFETDKNSLYQSTATFGGQQIARTERSKLDNIQQMPNENLHTQFHIPSSNLKLPIIDEMKNLQPTPRSNCGNIERMSYKFDKQSFPPFGVKNVGQYSTLSEAQLSNPVSHPSPSLKYPHQAKEPNNFGMQNSCQMNNLRHHTSSAGGNIDDTTSNTFKNQFPSIKLNNDEHTRPFALSGLHYPTPGTFKQLHDFSPNLLPVKQTNSHTFSSGNPCPLNLPLTRSHASVTTPRNIIAFQNLTHKMAKSNSQTLAYAVQFSQNAK